MDHSHGIPRAGQARMDGGCPCRFGIGRPGCLVNGANRLPQNPRERSPRPIRLVCHDSPSDGPRTRRWRSSPRTTAWRSSCARWSSRCGKCTALSRPCASSSARRWPTKSTRPPPRSATRCGGGNELVDAGQLRLGRRSHRLPRWQHVNRSSAGRSAAFSPGFIQESGQSEPRLADKKSCARMTIR